MASPPPLPPSGPPVGSTNLGIAPNVGGLLCYAPCCIGLVFSVVVAIAEKQSRFLRFHAFQSLLLHGGAIALALVFMVLQAILSNIIPFLGLLIFPLQLAVSVALLGLTIFLMIKAYNNEEYEIPQLGQLARQWA
jgi:uncharacterized membrane protein